MQLIFASSTLYEARGDQIERYGYAAFGLTVAPYAWMSFLNLVGNLVCPQYATMYIVESSSMDELKAPFGVSGAVGRLSSESEEVLRRWYETHYQRRDPFKEAGGVHHCVQSPKLQEYPGLLEILSFVSSMVPIGIVGGLSGFQKGKSATYQRAWTMVWLAFGAAVGPMMGTLTLIIIGGVGIIQDIGGMMSKPAALVLRATQKMIAILHAEPIYYHILYPIWDLQASFAVYRLALDRVPEAKTTILAFLRNYLLFTAIMGPLCYATGAAGGFVVVGQMLREYGTCVSIA